VLIETHANAHNDLVMMLFVLLAVWLWESGRYLGVLPALTLGALVKYVPLLLVPMAALLMGNRLARREWLRTLLASGLISLGLALVIFKPLWPGLERWSVWGQMQRVHFSTGAWLILLLRQVSAGAMAFRVAVWTMRLIFAAAYGVMLVWAVARPRSLAAAFHDLLYLWVVAGSMGFGYWYVAWLVPLAALGTGSVDLRRAATFSATGLLSVAVYTFLGTMWRERVGIDTLTLITVPLVFVTPFIVAGTRRREPSEVDRRRHREHAMEWFGPYPTALLYPWSAQVSHPVVGVPVLPFDDGASTEPGGAAGLQGPREPPTHAQGGQDGQVSGDC